MTAVDWSRPIEAVHGASGAKYSAVWAQRRQNRVVLFNGKELIFEENGEHKLGWRIRNVQPTTPERDPALWDRMVALVRRMAGHETPFAAECRAILADLPKPVDLDLLLAREIVAEEYGDGSNVAHLAEQARSGEGDEWFHTKVVLRAIRKLRAGEQA